jgi:hypothetical protein
VLLFPHLSGATLPTTTWSNNMLTVQMSDGQIDRIYFNTNADGRTRLQTYRVAGQGAVAPVPAGLTAMAGAAQISLQWSPSAGATGYNLKVSTTNGGPYTTVATGLTTTNFLHSNLLVGTSYFYVVSALNANGESENSAPAGAVPVTGTTVKPVIRDIRMDGDSLVVTGTNGTGANYILVSTTNLALPLGNWTRLATNAFGLNGGFSFTNPISPVRSSEFFQVILP